jgi:hypothetical protein
LSLGDKIDVLSSTSLDESDIARPRLAVLPSCILCNKKEKKRKGTR